MLDHCDLVNNPSTDLKINIDQHNSEIQTLIHNSEMTRLSEKESLVFNELKVNIDQMAAMERDYIRLPEHEKAEKL